MPSADRWPGRLRDGLLILAGERARRDENKRKLGEDERRIQVLLAQTGDLIQARRFKDAKSLALRTLELDPHNPFAKKYLEYAIQGIHTLADKGLLERKHEELWADELAMEIVTQPKEGTWIDFPRDWLERTRDRRAGIATDIAEEAFWVRNYRKILRERKVTLKFPDVPLQDVVLFLQDITGLNFVIAQGVEATERRVTVNLKDIVLENALKIILEQTKLTYIFDRESIIISEPGAAAGETYFEIYDVSDVLYKIQDFTAHRLTLPNPSAPSGGGAGGSLIFDDAKGGAEGSINADVLIEIVKGSTGGDEASEGVGSYVIQPAAPKSTSTQACASEFRTTALPAASSSDR
jgi:hypothetical protein